MSHDVKAARLAVTPQRGFVSHVWGLAATGLSLLYTVVLAPWAALFAALGWGRAVTRVSRLWGSLIIRTCGVKVEIQGLEHLAEPGARILVSNHQSFFDIFAIVAFIPGEPRFVAKKELLKIPVIGYALKHSGHVIIDRQAGGRGIRKAIETIRRGYTLCVFAEGHRYSDNRVHPFSGGAAWLAMLTRLPAVPMAISGTARMMPRGARTVVPGLGMKIFLGKPIETATMEKSERGSLTRRLEQAVRDMFVTEL